MIIINKNEIEAIVKSIDVVSEMEKGFIAYSNGATVVPPVGELLFDDPEGETHIKYGYIKGNDYYVIKIASGFPDNRKIGKPSGQGMMLIFSQKTGEPEAFLLDDGLLTDIRTAAAGALAAKYFAPKKVEAIGIIGTGVQAKLQLEYLKNHIDCNTVWVWGRSQHNTKKYADELDPSYTIHIAQTPSDVAKRCNLIITTTSSNTALLNEEDIRPGTHITAVGSDTAEKQELDCGILKKADLVIADSITQSKQRGEIYQALKMGFISVEDIIELGVAIQNETLQRSNNEQITVCDLTGVAVQDIMIATEVLTKFKNK